jgi:hypothetical protein
MTTEEFYARALLGAFPMSEAAIGPNQTKTIGAIASLAHNYAAALTDVFQTHRKSFQEESPL